MRYFNSKNSAYFVQKLEMEETHLDEFNEFNEIWDQRMIQFETQAKELEEEMVEKQQQDMEEFVQDLHQSLPQNPKESKELLNMRQIEKSLAKQ